MKFPKRMQEYASVSVRYRKRESASMIEFLTEKVVVHVDKKTGAVSFLNPEGKLLLAENPKHPRQIWEEKPGCISTGKEEKS